ncbi:MAG: Flp pilus assembly protein CpaB [Chloroflexota bacterium]|nr:Flp pilus assembly protein CpaB [Chloroflexota bacterium]
MPRRRGLILVSLGLLLALGTGALVFLLLRNAAPNLNPEVVQVQPTEVPVKRLPVAARLLESGTVISETDFAIQDFPIDTPAEGAITDTTTLVGEQVLVPVQPGEVFRAEQLLGAAGAPASNAIAEDRVLIAFPAGDLLNQTGVVTAGDHIDLLLTLDLTDDAGGETRTGKSTNFTVQNINVLRVVRGQPTEENPNPAPSALLLELEPQDAVRVKFVKDNGGVIDFALRSPLDTEEFEVNAYNLDNLRDDFGFTAPRSNASPTPQ